MQTSPLVSIIIPTKESARTLESCVLSCNNQSYKNIEVIVVDNFSTDHTQKISESLGAKFITCGPERNLQRPAGADIAQGDWLVFIDSDMTLSPYMIEDCLAQVTKNKSLKAFILPELSEGTGFWSRCKILERSCYLHYKPMEGIRMMEKQAYASTGGWDKTLIAGEDYDLFEKFIKAAYKIGRSHEFIVHNEGHIQIIPYLKKKFYYGKFIRDYLKNAKQRKTGSMARNFFLFRTCYYKNWQKLIKHPFLYIGMFFLIGMTQIMYFAGMSIANKK